MIPDLVGYILPHGSLAVCRYKAKPPLVAVLFQQGAPYLTIYVEYARPALKTAFSL